MEAGLYQSPLGSILVVADGESITGLWLEGQAGRPSIDVTDISDTPAIRSVFAWLDLYFKGFQPSIDRLNLCPNGTAFQRSVWKHLLKIPYACTITYGDIAKAIAKENRIDRMSAQAVGGAVGANPISIIIPCHRVIGAGGKLTGYAGGIEKKKWLLEHEQNYCRV